MSLYKVKSKSIMPEELFFRTKQEAADYYSRHDHCGRPERVRVRKTLANDLLVNTLLYLCGY